MAKITTLKHSRSVNKIILLICSLVLSTTLVGQIPDSLVVVPEIEKPKLQPGITFGLSKDIIDLAPDSFEIKQKFGFYAGANLFYNLKRSQLCLSVGAKFVRSEAFYVNSNNWPTRADIVPTSLMSSLSYNHNFKDLLFLKLGGSLILSTVNNSNHGAFDNLLDRTFTHTSLFFGISRLVKIGSIILYPELRYNFGLSTITSYPIFDSVKLHFLSLLIHINNG